MSVTEKLILKCLKKEEKQLKELPNLVKIDHDSESIILTFKGSLPASPILQCDGVDIPVKMEELVPKAILSIQDDEGNVSPVAEEVQSGFSENASKAYGITEAIGPHTVKNGKTVFETWKERTK